MQTQAAHAASWSLEALLKDCSSAELAPLVAILLARPSNSLGSSAKYKSYSPDHQKYHDLIAHEIRTYGGNSIANLFRGGEGISYRELVEDACRHLCSPVDEDIVVNEGRILDFFLPRRWDAIAVADRDRLVTWARWAAAGNRLAFAEQIRLQETGTNTGTPLSLRDMSMPSTTAILGMAFKYIIIKPVTDDIKDISSNISDAVSPIPGLTVTLPCLVQIAYLRRKRLEKQAPSAPPALRAARPDLAPHSGELVIPDANGEPALSVMAVSQPDGGAWLDDAQIRQALGSLSGLVPVLPSASAAFLNATHRYMQVVVRPGHDLISAADGIGLRAVTQTAGKPGIGGAARLFDPASLTAAINLTAVLAIASFVVGQMHMVEISRQLREIKQIVSDIKNFQTTQRRSEIEGAIDYLDGLSRRMRRGERPEQAKIEIESIDRNLLNLRRHLFSDVDILINKFSDGNYIHENIGTSGINQKIEKHIGELSSIFFDLTLCLRAQCYNAVLQSCYAGEELAARERLQDRQKDLAALRKALGDFDINARARIQTLDALTDSQATLNERKYRRLSEVNALCSTASGMIKTTEADADAVIRRIRASQEEPVTLILRLEGDRVAGVQYLEAS